MGFTKNKKSMNLLTNLNTVLDEEILIYYNNFKNELEAMVECIVSKQSKNG